MCMCVYVYTLSSLSLACGQWSKRKKASQQERWEDLTKEIRNKLNNKKTPGKGDETIKFIIFRLTYPRLDIAVSKMVCACVRACVWLCGCGCVRVCVLVY